MHLVVLASHVIPTRPSAVLDDRTHTIKYMRPRQRRGRISHSLGPGPWALGPLPWALCPQSRPRTDNPLRPSSRRPSSSSTAPLTSTALIPTGYWKGSANVALSSTVAG